MKRFFLAAALMSALGFVFNTPDIEEAKKLVATDPVIVNGEMVAEYHKFFASAALMAVNDIHAKIQKPKD